MQFREGANILTANGEKLGEIGRVVLDPKTKEVTNLVVEKGFLFTEEKVIPMSLVESATEKEVTLSGEVEFESLPNFQESHFIAAEVQPQQNQQPQVRVARSVYAYPPAVSARDEEQRSAYGMPNYVKTISRNIPKGSVALEIGANMLDKDGNAIGKVEEILMDRQADVATHLVVSEGLFLKEKKLIPASWIAHVEDNEVQISMSSDYVNGMPDYHPN